LLIRSPRQRAIASDWGCSIRAPGRAYWTKAPARPPVSNAVALADILRCLAVVADQAAGQKDVEADLWVRVSAA
jgi:hypothetical protein